MGGNATRTLTALATHGRATRVQLETLLGVGARGTTFRGAITALRNRGWLVEAKDAGKESGNLPAARPAGPKRLFQGPRLKGEASCEPKPSSQGGAAAASQNGVS